jgi:hypothetical protein
MKTIKYILYAFFVATTMVSCNLMNLSPLNEISDTKVWQDTALVQLYVNGCYNSIIHGFQEETLADACDESFALFDHGNEYTLLNGSMTSDNISSMMTEINYWSSAYSYIAQINTFFAKINSVPADQYFKNSTIGEMEFIRAFTYANLIWRYGGVPIITKVYGINDNSVTRSSYDDCVNFIVSDLDDAITKLPAKQPDDQKGRASGDACLALKSRVLLYDASALNNPTNDQSKWEAAAACTKLLIGKYALNDDYQSVFTGDNNEIIFARYFVQSDATIYNLWQGRSGSYGSAEQNPTQNLVNAYEMAKTGLLPYIEQADGSLVVNPLSGYDPQNPFVGRDPRFEATILHDGSIWQGRETQTFIGANSSVVSGTDSSDGIAAWNASQTGYYFKKFMVESVPTEGSSIKQTNPWIFFRYAEVLLNYAEEEFELGNEDIARQYLNMLRSRSSVNMPPVTDSGEALMARIQNERRVEFALEGYRFFDVRRWKIAETTEKEDILGMNIVKNSDGTKTYKIVSVLPRKFLVNNYLLPIERSEINKSGGSLIQNPGY